jgi:flavin-dependent dehydrogenase
MLAASPSRPGRSCIVAPERISVDVAIVGGGPAGCAAALTLRKYSRLRVALIERSRYATFRIGECLGPGVPDLLRYLDAEETLARTSPRASRGVAAAWGSSRVHVQDFFFTGRGPGWHVDRRRFDEALALSVECSGGQLLLETRVEKAERGSTGEWLLQLRQGAARQRTLLEARYLIDSTGRQAAIARAHSAKYVARDRMVGISGLYEFRGPAPDDGGAITLIEAVPSGWWYTAHLPSVAAREEIPGNPAPAAQIIVVFMTDADLARRHRLRETAPWKRNLARTEYIRPRLHGAKLRGPLQLHAAYSGKLIPPAGPGWIAAGDAAVSFDPLSSMGIGYALLSGIEAGRVAHNVLTGSGQLARAYSENINRHFSRYLQLRAAYYRQEQRWPTQPFWRRRHAE